MSMITKTQIKKIHTLANSIELSEDNYRALLFRFGVDSSKEFTKDEATIFINELSSIVNEQLSKSKNQRPTGVQIKGRLVYFDRKGKASDKQIDYIAGLWLQLSELKNYQSLMWFVKKITGKLYMHIESLTTTETRKVINALKSWEQSKKPSTTHR